MAAVTEEKPGIITRSRDFIEDVRAELKKVTWPTRADLEVSTKVTMYMLGIMGALIFLYDRIFQFVILGMLNLAS